MLTVCNWTNVNSNILMRKISTLFYITVRNDGDIFDSNIIVLILLFLPNPLFNKYFCLQHSQCSFHFFDLNFRIAKGLFKLVFNNMFMHVNVRPCICTKSRVPNNSKYENLWKVLWNTSICPQQCKKMVPMSLTLTTNPLFFYKATTWTISDVAGLVI